ncbi:hypothetical protein G4B88_008906 [Cannabis sativa]|uniref:Uncharacterized protein n=1 Tax=Cannabis sativa TaxID=3483 RepID=A0A7J6HRY2_CANSA|nr:hypothetical protein G4B88_008906 [Cannabis sativa]
MLLCLPHQHNAYLSFLI